MDKWLAWILCAVSCNANRPKFVNYKQMLRIRQGNGLGFFLPTGLHGQCPEGSSTFSRTLKTTHSHNNFISKALTTFMHDFDPVTSSFLGCIAKTAAVNEFPRGSYCFIKPKFLKCPAGFTETRDFYDKHRSIQHQFFGNGDFPPAGYFRYDSTLFYHCCREDGDPDSEVTLPAEFTNFWKVKSFALKRDKTQEKCQRFTGYTVSEMFWKRDFWFCIYQKPSTEPLDRALGALQGFGYLKFEDYPCGREDSPKRKPPFTHTVEHGIDLCRVNYIGTKRGTVFSKGNYCIVRNDACPYGFLTTIMEEISFCCRRDRGPTTKEKLRFPTMLRPAVYSLLALKEDRCPKLGGRASFLAQKDFNEDYLQCAYRNRLD